MRHPAAALGLLLALAAAAPAATPSPAALAAGLAGTWRGTLEYRDYQSDRPFTLPVRREVRALADGATVLSIGSFDDGPRVGIVTITDARLFDANAGTVSTTTLRKGRAVETDTDRVTIAQYRDPTHWTLRYERDGEDDDKPARLRTTETREGDTLTATKEVLPASASDDAWRFRNRTVLKREPPSRE